MKKITLAFIGFLFAVNCTKAQIIVLEYEYPSMPKSEAIYLMQIDKGLYKYLIFDYPNSKFTLYNLDHSLYLTVNVPITYSSNTYSIGYISKSLFDCDSSNLEYLVNSQSTNEFVKIFRTDGTEIFFADSARLTHNGGGYGLNNVGITKAPNGSKMTLDYGYWNQQPTHRTKVFSLCGELPAEIQEPFSGNSSSKAYPNPAINQITVEYKLSAGDNTGQLMLFDMTGKQVREYTVDSAFSNILIATSSLSPGTYYYTIKTKSSLIKGQKIIKIE